MEARHFGAPTTVILEQQSITASKKNRSCAPHPSNTLPLLCDSISIRERQQLCTEHETSKHTRDYKGRYLYRQSCPQKVIICLSFSKAEEKTVRSQPEEDQRNQAAKLTGLRTSHNISETKTARRFRSPKAKKLSNPEIRKTDDLQLPATQQTKQQGKQQEDTRNQEPRHPETKNQKPRHEETKQPGNRASQKPRTPGTWNQKTRNQGIQKPKITATQKPRNPQKPRKPKNKPRKPQKPKTQKPGIKESRTIVHSKMTKIPHPKMNLLAF